MITLMYVAIAPVPEHKKRFYTEVVTPMNSTILVRAECVQCDTAEEAMDDTAECFQWEIPLGAFTEGG